MLFNSLQFLLFFIVVTLSYFSLKWQGRWILLLIASCYFYMVFQPAYIVILFLTIVIDYIAGIWIEKSTGKTRRWLLILSLISNLGILAFFKYLGFFTENLSFLFEKLSMPGLADTCYGTGEPHIRKSAACVRAKRYFVLQRQHEHSAHWPVVPYISGHELYD